MVVRAKHVPAMVARVPMKSRPRKAYRDRGRGITSSSAYLLRCRTHAAGAQEGGEEEGEHEPLLRTKSSQYRGVTRRKRCGARWEASIVMNRKNCRCTKTLPLIT